MHGNWIVMAATAASANANPTTLSAVSNFPAYSDVFGTTGSLCVSYELDDGAGHFEVGHGMLNLATNSLSRDTVLATYDTGATPKYVNVGAVRLASFSAAVNVRCTPHATDYAASNPWTVALSGNTKGVGNGLFVDNLSNVDARSISLEGWGAYYPFLWTGSRPITSCSVYVKTVGGAGTTFRIGLMERRPDGSLALLREFTATSQFSGTVTGMQTRVAPTDFAALAIPPGLYVLQVSPAVSGTGPVLRAPEGLALCSESFLGRQSDMTPITGFLNGFNPSTLAATFSGTSPDGGSFAKLPPQVIFGMG